MSLNNIKTNKKKNKRFCDCGKVIYNSEICDTCKKAYETHIARGADTDENS